MSTAAYALHDSATMLRRDLRHSLRYPMMAIGGLLVPVFLLLLFVGVFGSTLRAGLGSAAPAGGHYIDYLTPGILVITAGASAAATAINVCIDMNEGIVARFRTMAITRTSVLTGQVLGSLTRTVISGVLVIAVAAGLGFRSSASPLEWLATAGLFTGLTLALTWLAIGFGLTAKNSRRRKQPVTDPAVPPLHQQRFRTHRLDARGRALVRGEPAVHTDHQHDSRTAHRDPDRQRMDRRHCLVRRDHSHRLRLVACAVRPL